MYNNLITNEYQIFLVIYPDDAVNKYRNIKKLNETYIIITPYSVQLFLVSFIKKKVISYIIIEDMEDINRNKTTQFLTPPEEEFQKCFDQW